MRVMMGVRKTIHSETILGMEVRVRPMHLRIKVQVPPTSQQKNACVLTPSTGEASVSQKAQRKVKEW